MVPESRVPSEPQSYDEAACARWVPEPAKQPGRTGFERDRARVLHSSALRRLAGKTQVVDPGESDFPRTRLTHSLECAQIGRELGKALGADPDLVETACLAHDLGHPPFGHNGEAALDAVAHGCGGFEGNAQSLRVLTRLEAKIFDSAGQSAGLNLTRAALDAAIKYPWPRTSAASFTPPDAEPLEPAEAFSWRGSESTRPPGAGSSQQPPAGASADGDTPPWGRPTRTGPYGVYADDTEVFAWVRRGAPPRHRCLEAQVMDWADDVAYSVHDLEDGLHAGHVELPRLRDPTERRAVCKVASGYADASPEELDDAFGRLLALPYWPVRYDGDPRSLAALKDLTSQLIGRFCAAAESATRGRYGHGPLCRYAAELVVPRRQRLECAVLKGITARYVMSRAGASVMRADQREVVVELADALWREAPAALDPALRPAFTVARDDSSRLRVVVDQVAALTDTSAVAWWRRLAPAGGREQGFRGGR